VTMLHNPWHALRPQHASGWRLPSSLGADWMPAVVQLRDVIHKIKNNPDDRRIILSAWNPAALPSMALPPCHMFCQVLKAVGSTKQAFIVFRCMTLSACLIVMSHVLT
jgi:thymidylate synthase